MISSLKKINREKKNILSSKEYRVGNSLIKNRNKLKEEGIGAFFSILDNYKRFKKGKSYSMASYIKKSEVKRSSDYFNDDRIAVYTCIIGNYDQLQEPLFCPDNCDFYAITDFNIPPNSCWKRIDVRDYESEVSQFNSVMTNRYFKFHPEKLFRDYKYSVYVDGNIRIYTDMTEYINRIAYYGLATFSHSQRNCVYKEAEACIAMGKAEHNSITEQIQYIRNQKMPEQYGLPTCCIIAREHNQESCIKLMDSWWEEFLRFPYRDQLSFPFALFKNKVEISKITVLGENVFEDDSFEFVNHIK